MLVIFAIIIGGIITGRLLSSWRLVFVSRMITVIIWLLLFLLGLEVGSDPAVVGGMATLGRTAFVIFSMLVAGSICMSWLLWRCVRRRDAVPDGGGAESPGLPAAAADFPRGAAGGQAAAGGDTRPLSVWDALRGSLVIVAFFVAGCLAGLFSALPVRRGGVAPQHLCALCPDVLRGDHPRQRYGPCGACAAARSAAGAAAVMTAVGTLAGAALSTLLLPPLTAGDTMAVGAGFGYYSLSSIFIADFRGAELGTVALLCNVMRELFTLLAAPLVARWFGRWPPSRSAEPRLSIPPCRSSRSPQGNPMPWCRSSTAACSISASRSW